MQPQRSNLLPCFGLTRHRYAVFFMIWLITGSGSVLADAKAIAAFDLDKLNAIPVLTRCHDLYLFRTAPADNGILAERALNQLEDSIVAQAVASKQELLLAREERLRVGMSQCALLAVKGSAAFSQTTQTGQDLRVKYRYPDGSTVLTYQGQVIEWSQD